eukprot:TRINITY_DN3848_c0_g1_i5.p1 TRINITY_DN3848_c0_g1~~TRINITY_DN3848_c0_g1_i5.p1  ORF type:complete len:443 (-),score=91.36 TRINITY_DN3848_c0_g1_i5:239-1522(-)
MHARTPCICLLLFAMLRRVESGQKWKRGDTDEDLLKRVSGLQAKMSDLDMDAVLLTSEANIRYFTGWRSQFWQSPTRSWFVIVPASGKPIAVVPTIGEKTFAEAHTQKVVSWPAPRVHDDGLSEVREVILHDVVRKSGRIGAEMGQEQNVRMPMSDFDRLRSMLAEKDRTFVDAVPAIKAIRLVKSEQEIAKISATCRAQAKAYDQFPELLFGGMTEAEACNLVKRTFLLNGVDDTPYVICRSGEKSYDDIVTQSTDREMNQGDVLIIDSGSQIDGYYCDFNRNFAFGEPSAEVAGVYDKIWRASEVAITMARPGVTFADLYNAMAEVMQVSGEGGVGRMGHSVGLQLTEGPSIQPSDMTVLEEGMVIAIEPSLDLPSGEGKFLVVEETVLITSEGCRLITKRAPKKIPVVRKLERPPPTSEEDLNV